MLFAELQLDPSLFVAILFGVGYNYYLPTPVPARLLNDVRLRSEYTALRRFSRHSNTCPRLCGLIYSSHLLAE